MRRRGKYSIGCCTIKSPRDITKKLVTREHRIGQPSTRVGTVRAQTIKKRSTRNARSCFGAAAAGHVLTIPAASSSRRPKIEQVLYWCREGKEMAASRNEISLKRERDERQDTFGTGSTLPYVKSDAGPLVFITS